MRSPRLFFGVAVVLGLAAIPAAADDAAPAAVGRVATVVGGVDYAARGTGWSLALVNEPVFAGTSLRSDAAGRAALEVVGARVALAPASELAVATLSPDLVQIGLKAGRIGIHLDASMAARTVEVDLREGGVWLSAPGDYDIAAGGEHMPARVAVFAGAAKFGGDAAAADIAPGTIALLHGIAPVGVTASAAVSDGFTDWWRAAATDDDLAPSTHLSAAIAGAAELAGNGVWKTDPTYGEVWYPRGLLDDWAPFRYGRWRLLAAGGWTWIDDAPWGFAPAHYGAWVQIDDRWAWVPGPQSDAPAYVGARVAFLGTPEIGLSSAGGTAVAWFPLGPGEQPGETPPDDFHNRHFASAVPRAVFVGGKPVSNSLIDLPEWRVADAPIIDGAFALLPPQPRPAAAVLFAARKPAAGRGVTVAARARAAVKTIAVKTAARKPGARLQLAASTRAAVSPHNRKHLAAARTAVP
jgi:hypothetical protein